jgi:hypothetical protein
MYQGPKSASFSSESGFFSRGAAECVTFIMTVPVFFATNSIHILFRTRNLGQHFLDISK